MQRRQNVCANRRDEGDVMSRPPTSIRGKARQNLLVATVNVAVERQLITLDCQPFKAARFEFELAGLPVLATS